MRTILFLGGFAVTSLLFSESAFALGPAAPAPSSPAADDKGISLGGDLQFVIPLGDFGDASGPLVGPVVRAGYRVLPALELNLKLGFLFGVSKDRSVGPISASSGVNILPVSVGGRYFFMEPAVGLYGGADIVFNVILPKAEVGGVAADGLESSTRLGANLGVGYLISKKLPIDIRAQFMILNLLLKEKASAAGVTVEEKTLFGLGLSAGYTVMF